MKRFNVTALLMARKLSLETKDGVVIDLLQCDRAFDGAEIGGN